MLSVELIIQKSMCILANFSGFYNSIDNLHTYCYTTDTHFNKKPRECREDF